MRDGHFLALQALVFTLVTAAFTNIYITQPVLPVLSVEFGINETTASFSVSAVILGIALGLGLWLDAATGGERRVYTFILILASVPVTMVVVFFFSRWFSARMTPPKVETDPEQYDFLEDADSGND